MKKTFSLFLLVLTLSLNACAPLARPVPTAVPATETAAPTETQIPTVVSATDTVPPADHKFYENAVFGLGFQYPSGWFGPDEYVSGDTLRVAVGSDIVYPYGTDRTEQIYEKMNSYYVVIQYTKNNQNDYWKDTYQTLTALKDGESVSGARGKIIRIKQLDLGKFSGFEYIATLSESAQTEPVYMREVMLIDDQSDLLTISGQPNNVEISAGSGWREAYQSVDELNQAAFHEIVNSITIQK